tara:strand:+ start:1010 stop:1303 length:294 start_codon:yes stop_codon:yes gene_type:complete
MKIFHFQLEDSLGNKKTLICSLRRGSIKYRLYRGWGDSGMLFDVNNILLKLPGEYLPVDTNYGESKEEFTLRVWKMLEDSTDKPIRNVNANVKFADQ